MNPEGGYTRQYRRLWDNPVFRNKQEAAIFSWLKDAAAWRPTVIKTRFRTITLAVGELLITERQVAEDFGLDRKRLRSLLQRMVEAGMIALSGVAVGTKERTKERTAAGTIVTIQKYSDYQGLRVVHGGAKEPVPEPRSGPKTGPLYINKEERKEDTLPPNGGRSADGAAPPPDPPDPIKAIFGRGIGMLGPKGRRLLAKLVKQHGDLPVLDAIAETEEADPIDPTSFLIRCLSRAAPTMAAYDYRTSPGATYYAAANSILRDIETGRYSCPGIPPDGPLLVGDRTRARASRAA